MMLADIARPGILIGKSAYHLMLDSVELLNARGLDTLSGVTNLRSGVGWLGRTLLQSTAIALNLTAAPRETSL